MRIVFTLICSVLISSIVVYPACAQPLKIGGMFALSGMGASQGTEEYRAAQLAVEKANKQGGIDNRPIDFIVEDVSFAKLNKAAISAQKLISLDKVIAAIGPTWDEPAQTMLPLFETAKVPLIGQSQTEISNPNGRFSFFFCTFPDSIAGVRAMLSYAQQNNLRKIVFIRPFPGGFCEYISRAAEHYAPQYGVEVIEVVDLNDPSSQDYRSILLRIKAKHPDAIYTILNGSSVCPFTRQAAELKIGIPILATESAGDIPALKVCSKEMEQLTFSHPKRLFTYDKFESAFKEKYGHVPEAPTAAATYDALNVLIAALKKTHGSGGEALRNEIANTSDYSGALLDKIAFNNKGFVITNPDSYEIRTIKDGRIITKKLP